MLIAISGSQGSGKSTVLEKLKELGYNVIERKTSRSILTDWDVTLDAVNNDLAMTVKFQEEITKRKWMDEVEAIASPDVWYTERTHMDLFTYAMIILGKDNKYSDWLDQYYNTCFAYTQAYDSIFFLPAGRFEIERDGVRSKNQHYSKVVDMMLRYYLSKATQNTLHVVLASDINERVSEITKNHY